MLRIKNLSKTYPGSVEALRNVSIEVPRGMFGLLGPNGAGKSTLMRTVATLQDADSGSIHFGDLNVRTEKQALRRVLGYLPQEFGVYPRTSAESLLDQLAVLKGLLDRPTRREEVRRLLVMTNLHDVRKRKLSTFSGGMLRRFGIAQALLGSPELLIVDEPTAGLDPEERQRFLNLLSEVGENVVVILSTHIVEDVHDLCSRMAVLSNGEILAAGAPRDLVAKLEGQVWRKAVAKSDVERCRSTRTVLSTRLVAGQRLMRVLSDVQPEEGFQAVDPDLEDVYFATLQRSVAAAH